MPDFGAIPWLGVLVAVVASQIIGFLWYGPLFGKSWLAALGKTEEELKAGSKQGLGNAIVIGIVASIVTAIALAIILTMSQTPDLASGAKIGLLGAVGLVATFIVTMSAYEQRNPTGAWIAIGNQVVTLPVMGAIIGAMW
jgi:hypothetical protein